jgi:hypothetical protein
VIGLLGPNTGYASEKNRDLVEEGRENCCCRMAHKYLHRDATSAESFHTLGMTLTVHDVLAMVIASAAYPADDQSHSGMVSGINVENGRGGDLYETCCQGVGDYLQSNVISR